VATQLNADRSQFLRQDFQEALSCWNRKRLSPTFPTAISAERFEDDRRMLRLEIGFLEELRQEVSAEARKAPTNPDGFISWFEDLKAIGPGQHDRLFPWLAERANRDEMRWFLSQEAAGEAGFD